MSCPQTRSPCPGFFVKQVHKPCRQEIRALIESTTTELHAAVDTSNAALRAEIKDLAMAMSTRLLGRNVKPKKTHDDMLAALIAEEQSRSSPGGQP